MDSGKTAKKCNKEFRQMAVDFINQSIRSKTSAVNTAYQKRRFINKWIEKLKPISLEDRKFFTLEDYLKLQKEMGRIQEENEILKKAMARRALFQYIDGRNNRAGIT
jgi:transposase